MGVGKAPGTTGCVPCLGIMRVAEVGAIACRLPIAHVTGAETRDLGHPARRGGCLSLPNDLKNNSPLPLALPPRSQAGAARSSRRQSGRRGGLARTGSRSSRAGRHHNELPSRARGGQRGRSAVDELPRPPGARRGPLGAVIRGAGDRAQLKNARRRMRARSRTAASASGRGARSRNSVRCRPAPPARAMPTTRLAR